MSEAVAAAEAAGKDKGSTAESPELQGIYTETPEGEAEAEKGAGKEEVKTEVETEAKPAEESQEQEAKEDDKGEEKGKEADGPPESYDWILPEGMELDEAGVKEFEPMAREWGLTQKQLEQGIEFYASRMQTAVGSVVDAMKTQAEAQSTAWTKEVEADNSIGAEGLRAAARAVERFGSAELKEVLEDTGMGNHPELVRFCQWVGEKLSEDTLVTGQGSGQQTPADDGQPKGIYGL